MLIYVGYELASKNEKANMKPNNSAGYRLESENEKANKRTYHWVGIQIKHGPFDILG